MGQVPFRQAVSQEDDPLAVALAHCRSAEARLRDVMCILDSCGEAIIVVEPDGMIAFWSPGAEHLFGYKAAEAEGRRLSFLAPAGFKREFEQLVCRAAGNPVVRDHETRARRKNGVLLDVSLSVAPMEGRDTACVVMRDITDRRWMAETLNKTLGELESALGETRRSEERYRRFTADAAHQLRTPIAGIRACAEILLRRPSADEQELLLTDVVRETARASRLVTALLQLSRLDQGQRLTPRPCDALELCRAEVDRVRPLAAQLTIDVVVKNLPPRRPELDGNAVGEILSNLLDNACRHASAHIEVSLDGDDRHLEISVGDDGPGVAPEAAERIFDRFVSLDGAGGSGLGLPIGRALARAHGGDLTYENRAFVLRLPVKSAIDCGGAGRPDFAGSGSQETVDWESWAAP